MHKFKCLTCGSEELSYEKWIKCREKVSIRPDGHVEYFDQDINDTDMLPVECRFICACCGKPLMFYGNSIVTEAELQDYLDMTVDQRAEMQAEYEALEQEKAQYEDQRQALQIETYFTEANNLKEIKK